MINKNELEILQRALHTMALGNEHLPDFTPQFDADAVSEVVNEAARLMQDNYPYYHPQYAGQMLKPPHPVARIAYALSLWVNPNNHALDGSRASSPMEKECVAALGQMFGWDAPLGHLTGGGTVANLEALWVASRLKPGARILGSQQAHYTHSRLCEVLGISYSAIEVDGQGRMLASAIQAELDKGDVGTVVATIGNTGLGAVDPLPAILELQEQFDFRVHADAAYGGYFGLASLLGEQTRQSYDSLGEVDSIVIDPHKHGLQPYGCGCVLFKDPSVGQIYQHDSPYTYFSSDELHLGEISLECSRPGASAVALWATQKLMPMVPGGQFARDLDDCLAAARALHSGLQASDTYVPLMPPELDIVVYAISSPDTLTASQRAKKVFHAAAERELHLALMEVPAELAAANIGNLHINSESITCLRSTLMKPEHKDWTDRLLTILGECAESLA